jgi:hypothetical protein
MKGFDHECHLQKITKEANDCSWKLEFLRFLVSSYNFNFECYFFEIFLLKVKDCNSFGGYGFFHLNLEEKAMFKKHIMEI